MIKCDFGKQTVITGHAVQIATELECLARDVRIALCNTLGEEAGMEMYGEAIKMAALNTKQRNQFCEEEMLIAKTVSPELAKRAEEYTDMLMKELFGGGTSSPDSVEEE